MNNENYTPGSTEAIVQKELNELISLVKERSYTAEFKASDQFSCEETDLETLGRIISKYCNWNGNEIAVVSNSAFEDSNYTSMEGYLSLPDEPIENCLKETGNVF